MSQPSCWTRSLFRKMIRRPIAKPEALFGRVAARNRGGIIPHGSQIEVLHDFTKDVESLRASIAEKKPEIFETFATPGVLSAKRRPHTTLGLPDMAAAKSE